MMRPARRGAAMVATGLLLAACGTPAPAVPAVDLGRPAGSSATTDLPPAQLPPSASTLDGEYSVMAGEAATVRVGVTAGAITVVELAVAPGWQQVQDNRAPGEVDMRWVNGDVVVTLDIELDDGRLESDVDIEVPGAAGQYTYQVGEAGTVTIDVSGDRVALVAQRSAPGWVATVDERELAGGEVEIRFRADGALTTVDFDAEVENSVLNVDIDTQTGRDYTAPPAS